jgi:hypothetical protein
MRSLFIIANLVASCLTLAQQTTPDPSLNLPKLLSSAETVALEAKEKKEHEEAMARLPVLTEERLKRILDVLRDIKYPIRFDALGKKLGGPDSLVWCCTRNHSVVGEKTQKQTSTFFVARDTTDYELVVDYEDSPIDQPPNIVARARLCFTSPLGWRFEAESEEDWLRVGVPKKTPNQVPGRGSS